MRVSLLIGLAAAMVLGVLVTAGVAIRSTVDQPPLEPIVVRAPAEPSQPPVRTGPASPPPVPPPPPGVAPQNPAPARVPVRGPAGEVAPPPPVQPGDDDWDGGDDDDDDDGDDDVGDDD